MPYLGLICPYFCENKDGATITVNEDTYRTMITNFFVPTIHFYTSHGTIVLLSQTFDGRLISRIDDVNWSPRSCDLIPLGYSLYGAVFSQQIRDN